jgi:hypothetical protein
VCRAQTQAVRVAAEKPLGLDEIAAAKGIAGRPAEALLAVCVSVGLIQLRGGRFSLTPLGEEYMLPSSPTYFGWKFDAWRLIYSVWSPDSLRDAVLSDKPQGVFSDPAGAFASWHAEHAADFTRAMHSASIGPAMVWPRKVDLAKNRVMLDIGGGSGAHSIGAVTLRPKLPSFQQRCAHSPRRVPQPIARPRPTNALEHSGHSIETERINQ